MLSRFTVNGRVASGFVPETIASSSAVLRKAFRSWRWDIAHTSIADQSRSIA